MLLVQQYETTFIVDAHLPTEKTDETIERFLSFIEKKGSKIHHVDRWGKRRLAYEIKKKQYGYYVYVRFESGGEFIRVLEREYKLDDAILRYLTVLVPKVALESEKARLIKEDAEDPGSDVEEYSESGDEDEEDMRIPDSEQSAEVRKEPVGGTTEPEERSGQESEKEEGMES